MTFTIIISHIFPENFIEITRVVQKIWGISLSILANFHQFSSIFWIFWHFLVTKKLVTPTYNRWYQHFFTFDILQTDCLTIYWYQKFLLEMSWNMGGQFDSPLPPPLSAEKTTLKKASLTRVTCLYLWRGDEPFDITFEFKWKQTATKGLLTNKFCPLNRFWLS